MNQGTTQHGATDASYGQTAVSLGFATEAQVQECLQVQAKMREMGIDEPLGEIMSKKGFVTPQHHSNILKKLGVQVSPIPGYTILGKIGQGGMGAVYKAVQTSVNRTVAIKIMSASAVKDKTYVSRFFQEAQAAAALNHKNLIQAIDVGAAGGLYYFVMEFVTGKSCREILNAKGPFDEGRAIDVAMQMTEVLDHIHSHSMVHRDIKPENILLTNEGTVKLCDLGLAKSTAPAEQSLTQDGLAVGTPYFMSPEQVRGDKDVDIRADLYSLGATLFFLVTGKHPFDGKSAAETMSLHLNAPVPDPRKAAPALSEDFAWVIHKLMGKERKERYQKPLDLLEDLKKIKAGTSPQHARQHAAKVHLQHKAQAAARLQARKPVPRWPIFVGGGAVVASAAVVLAVMTGSSTPGEVPKHGSTPAAVRTETVIVKVPESPKDDPKRAAEAGRLYATAVELYKKQEWAEAKQELEKLKKDYSDLQYTRDNSKTAGEMIGICDVRLREQSSALAVQIEDARAAMRDGRWKEASDRFQLLLKAGAKGLGADAEHCRREIAAEELLADGRAQKESGHWLEAQVKLSEFGQKHKETETFAKHKDEFIALSVAVTAELRAVNQLTLARSTGAASSWGDLTKALAELEALKETRTAHANEGEIRDLVSRRDQAMAKLGEDLTKQKYVEATNQYDRDISEKKYDDAQQVLRHFSQVFAATKYYEQKKVEIDTKIAEAVRKKNSDRDTEARKIHAQYPKDLRAGNFEAALEGILRLLNEYPDLSIVKSNESQIKKDKAKCEQNIGVPENVLVLLEFEDYPGSWQARNGATAGNSDEPYQGKRAGRLLLPGGGRAFHPIVGITGRAESITFWARSVRKGGPVPNMDFLIQDDAYTFSVEFQPTAEWKPYGFRFSEFRPLGDAARAKKVTPNLNQIRDFGFGPTNEAPGSGVVYEIQIDSLRVEGKR